MMAGVLSLLAIASASNVQAEDKKPDNEVTGNVSLTTDYRFRGISQTRVQPALQGGVDYTHNPTGFYLGAWASTIKWVKDAGGSTDIELDLYGGKKGEIAKDVSYDVGGLAYVYAGNGLNPSANTFEIYGQLGYGPAYIKYSHTLTNAFGFADSKNSGYFDLGANIDLGSSYTLNLHLGHQVVKRNSAFNYTDYKVGVTKDFGVCSVSAAVIGGDSKAYVGPGVDGKNLSKAAVVLAVSKTF
ncbi:MAG: hypothetical protein HYZ45_14885 [Burkholderiales bacterium]|nr:hypothetical protein [Burkholderiales bacterium]